nr:hypothetical protein [Tanacetum cinerariifolium]
MSDASSAVTYTSVYMDFEPWRYYEEDSTETEPPRVIVYGYDGLPIQPVASPSPDYVPGLEHPPSPDYVPRPEHPPSPVEIPYVPEPEYPEYLEPSDDEAPLEDQPLPIDASPIAASPDYEANFDPKEDPEEDPEDDQADYLADGRDGDDEPFDDDDDDTDDEDSEEEPFEDEEDDEEEQEHLALTYHFAVPIVDPVLPAGDAAALEADKPTYAPGSPIIIHLSQTRLRKAQKTVRLEPPMSASMEACIARHAALPSPPLLVPSLPLPLPSLLITSPTNTEAPLGYRAAEIKMRALLPSPTPGFEIRESSAAGAARQPGPIKSDPRRCRVEQEGYGITDTDRPDHRRTATLMDREAMYTREAYAYSMDRSSAIAAHVRTLETQKMAPKKRTTRATPATTTTPTTTITNAKLQALINRGVAAALAERDADRSRNGDNNNDSGTGGRRQRTTLRECTYTDFLKCQPMSFQGTEGVVELANVERYISGLPDMIHGTIKASKPQSMQEAIKFATEIIDKKMLTHVERQSEHKRKFDNTSRNNQHQQQPFKRNNPSDDDDDDTDDEDLEEDPFEDEEDDEEENEHLAPADSSAVPIVDLILPAGDTEALEADEPTHTPESPIIIPFPRHVFDESLTSIYFPQTDILEADMSPRKRGCLTTPTLGFEVRESSAAGIARERPDHPRMAMLIDREAMYAREACVYSEDRSSAIAAYVRTLEAQIAALIAQTSSLQTQLTTTLGRIEILEARDLEP